MIPFSIPIRSWHHEKGLPVLKDMNVNFSPFLEKLTQNIRTQMENETDISPTNQSDQKNNVEKS